jgi:hypothetical protein
MHQEVRVDRDKSEFFSQTGLFCTGLAEKFLDLLF